MNALLIQQVSELFSGSQFDILSPLRGWRWAVLRRMQAVWEQSQALQPLQAPLNIESSTTSLVLYAGPSTSSIWSSRFLLHSLIPWHSNVNNRTFLAFILHQHYIKSSDLNHMTVVDIENSFAFFVFDSRFCSMLVSLIARRKFKFFASYQYTIIVSLSCFSLYPAWDNLLYSDTMWLIISSAFLHILHKKD